MYLDLNHASLHVVNKRARHWINVKYRDDLELRNGAEHFVGDRGRTDFLAGDLSEKCKEIEDKLHDCSILEVRKDCPWTCDIYLESSFYEEGFSGPGLLE